LDYAVTMTGVVAGALTTFSLLPQLFKVIRRRSAKDLSRTWLVTSSVGFVLWTYYGYRMTPMDMPVVLFSILSLVFSLALLTMKLRYK
jgi:MtN3 and saliva related transmembrane protein